MYYRHKDDRIYFICVCNKYFDKLTSVIHKVTSVIQSTTCDSRINLNYMYYKEISHCVVCTHKIRYHTKITCIIKICKSLSSKNL